MGLNLDLGGTAGSSCWDCNQIYIAFLIGVGIDVNFCLKTSICAIIPDTDVDTYMDRDMGIEDEILTFSKI